MFYLLLCKNTMYMQCPQMPKGVSWNWGCGRLLVTIGVLGTESEIELSIATLSVQQAPGTHLSLPQQRWDYKCAPVSCIFQCEFWGLN